MDGSLTEANDYRVNQAAASLAAVVLDGEDEYILDTCCAAIDRPGALFSTESGKSSSQYTLRMGNCAFAFLLQGYIHSHPLVFCKLIAPKGLHHQDTLQNFTLIPYTEGQESKSLGPR